MMRERYLEAVNEYKDRLEPFMKKLVALEAWTRIKRDVKQNYSFTNNGILFVYKVNISGTVDDIQVE